MIFRLFDIFFSLIGLIFGAPLFIVIIIFGIYDTRSPIFCQVRVGLEKKPFVLFKFRTMSKETPSVASHLVSSSLVTPFGHFLRKTKLDEIPQLWNVLKGDMSLIGPRPNLLNQKKLIKKRQELGVYKVKPGITGLSQIKKIDMSTPDLLAKTDIEMINNMSVNFYFKLIILTLTGKGQGDRVRN